MAIRFWLVGALILLISYNGFAQYCMLVPVPLDQRVNTADAVIEGKVVKQQSYWNQEHTQILTANFIEVYKVFKGTAIPDTIAFVVQGGEVGPDKLVVQPGIELTTGNYGTFTLVPLSDDFRSPSIQQSNPAITFYRDNAWSQSFIKISGNQVQDIFYPLAGANARQQLYQHIFNSLGTTSYLEKKAYYPAIFKGQQTTTNRFSAILSFSPTTVAAGTLSNQSVLTINGSGFGATQGNGVVWFPNADDGGSTMIAADPTIVNQYISWTDTKVEVRVPGGAGTGIFELETNGGTIFTSGSSLTVDFNASDLVSNAAGSGNYQYEPDLVSDNGSGGYTLTYNSGFYSNSAALTSFQDALKNWVFRTGVNFTDAGATTSAISTNNSADGVNIISFSGSLPGGTLGVSFSSYSGCGFGGNPLSWEWFLQDVDLLFNSSISWYYGCDATAIPFTSYDFESVAVHELGHHHQLGHIINPAGVMHYSIANSQVKRTIQANDKEGGDYVIGHSTDPHLCVANPMTLITGPAPTCAPVPLPVELVSFEAKPTGQSQVKLTWITATELNNSHFIIERSQNGRHFEPLQQVTGKGTTNNLTTYHSTDSQPFNGISYYRLKQVDFDGTFAFSKIESVNLNQKAAPDISIFPNPADKTFFIKLPETQDQPIVISVQDVIGKEVYRVPFSSFKNNLHLLQFEKELSPGMYLVKVTVGNKIFTEKLIINR